MGRSQVFPSVRLVFIIYYSTPFHLYASSEDEGVPGTICDIVLLIFHLALSSFTFDGVDNAMAQNILDRNLRPDPNGKPTSSSGGKVSVSDPRASRFVLPIRQWTTSSLSQPTPQGNQILYQSTPVTIPVSESAPYLLLGDRDCQLPPVGHPCISPLTRPSGQGYCKPVVLI